MDTLRDALIDACKLRIGPPLRRIVGLVGGFGCKKRRIWTRFDQCAKRTSHFFTAPHFKSFDRYRKFFGRAVSRFQIDAIERI